MIWDSNKVIIIIIIISFMQKNEWMVGKPLKWIDFKAWHGIHEGV